MNIDQLMTGASELVDQLVAKHDIMAASVLATASGIEARLNEEGWDAPPRLFTLRRVLGPPLPNLELMMLSAREIALDQFPQVDGDVLTAIIDAIAESIPNTPPEVREDIRDLVGWLVTSEGHMVIRQGEEPRGKFKDEPDAVELRFVWIADIADNAYFLLRRRDTDQVYAQLLEPGSAVQQEGQIPEALQALTRACLAIRPD